MTRLLLVRHGQSAWNASGRWQGWADPPLTELGRQQAWAAASSIGTVDAIVASDLDRAVATAMVISEVIGVGPVVIEPGLRERDVGEWTGLTRAEIAERWPDALSAVVPGRGAASPLAPPGGEPVSVVVERVSAALHRVAGLVGQVAEAVVITHGGVIRALEHHLGVVPEPIPNLGARWVDVGAGGEMSLGDRLLLIDATEVAVTVPRQL